VEVVVVLVTVTEDVDKVTNSVDEVTKCVDEAALTLVVSKDAREVAVEVVTEVAFE
jgi:hypothetical protein